MARKGALVKRWKCSKDFPMTDFEIQLIADNTFRFTVITYSTNLAKRMEYDFVIIKQGLQALSDLSAGVLSNNPMVQVNMPEAQTKMPNEIGPVIDRTGKFQK